MQAQYHSDLQTMVLRAFSPTVAVLCSGDADSVSRKNNLTFSEMLQPFSKMTVEGTLKEPNGQELKIQGLKVTFQDFNWRPPAAVVAKKMLGDAVLTNQSTKSTFVNTGLVDIEVPSQMSWYGAWRETFFNIQEVYEHEFMRHCVSCVFVVSSTHPNPTEQFTKMNQHLNQILSQASQPAGLVYQTSSQSLGSVKGDSKQTKFFSPSISRYFLLLHDVIDGHAGSREFTPCGIKQQFDSSLHYRAESVYQSLKTTYGGHCCHLLAINSRTAVITDGTGSLPNPWLTYLPKKPLIQAEPDPPDVSVDASLPICIEEGEQVIGDQQEAELLDAMREPYPGGKLKPSPSEISMTSLSSGEGSVTNGVIAGHDASVKVLPLGTKTDSQYGSSNSLTSVSGLGPLTFSEDIVPPVEGVPHGACLTSDDMGRIQSFVNEFSTRSLLPSVERQIKELHDTREHLGKSAFIRRTLGKDDLHHSLLHTIRSVRLWLECSASVIVQQLSRYQPDSPQLQVRRLADLAFIFGHYDLAYQAYHTAKRDFESDQAWVYYAGALEMAALSVVMHNIVNPSSIKPVPYRYFDEAINTYTNVCKNQMLGLRAGILSFESLKESHQYADAAKLCVRLTAEDSDLRSALMLEQAAYCFARMLLPYVGHEVPSTVPRACKYAFHLILSGHRYAKAGQRRHASRVYKQALVVYQGSGWTLAEDHILLTLGRHMSHLKENSDAMLYFEQLLRSDSKQAAAQQYTFLKEFTAVGQDLQLEEGVSKFPELPVPSVYSKKIRVLVQQSGESSDDADVTIASGVSIHDDDALHPRWSRLEELVVQKAKGSLSTLFKPTVSLLTEKTNNSARTTCYCNESVKVEVPFRNDLRIPLSLENLYLLWKFKPAGSEEEFSEESATASDSLVLTQKIASLQISAESNAKVILEIVPQQTGQLQIYGIAYSLVYKSADLGILSAVRGKKLFSLRGPRLNSTTAERKGVVYAQDQRLSFDVKPPMPRLQVSFRSIPDFMLCGEVRQIAALLTNIGSSPVKNVHVSYSDPKAVHFSDSSPSDKFSSKINIPSGDNLEPGASFETTFWLRASDDSGLMSLDLVFYYDCDLEEERSIRHRLIRHSIQVFLSDSLAISAKALRSSLTPTSSGYSDLISLILNITSRRDNSDDSINDLEIEEVSMLSPEWKVAAIPDLERVRVIQPMHRSSLVVTCIAAGEVKDSPQDSSRLLAERCVTSYSPLIEGTAEKEYDSREEVTYERKLELLLEESTTVGIPLLIRWKTLVKNEEDPSNPQVVLGLHCLNLCAASKVYQIPPVIPIVPSSQSTDPKILRFLTFDENGEVIKSDGKKRTEFLENEVAKTICYRFEYEPEVVHDFKASRMCLVPVKIVVFNSFKRPIEVKIAGIDPRLPPRNQLYLPEALAPFTWVGPSQKWTKLEPRVSKEVVWSVCLSMPGTYCLDNRLKLDCRVILDNGPPRVFGQLLKFDFELLVTSR